MRVETHASGLSLAAPPLPLPCREGNREHDNHDKWRTGHALSLRGGWVCNDTENKKGGKSNKNAYGVGKKGIKNTEMGNDTKNGQGG